MPGRTCLDLTRMPPVLGSYLQHTQRIKAKINGKASVYSISSLLPMKYTYMCFEKDNLTVCNVIMIIIVEMMDSHLTFFGTDGTARFNHDPTELGRFSMIHYTYTCKDSLTGHMTEVTWYNDGKISGPYFYDGQGEVELRGCYNIKKIPASCAREKVYDSISCSIKSNKVLPGCVDVSRENYGGQIQVPPKQQLVGANKSTDLWLKMEVSNPRDDRAERNLGGASVPLSTVIPWVGNFHLEQNPI